MLDLGDQIVLTYPSKPASPATVTVTIGLPDNSTAGPFSATSGSYAYTTTQVGRHTVLWVSTGPSDAYSDVFEVAAGDMGSLISLADAKAHLGKTSTTNDEELRLYLSAVTSIIQNLVGVVTRNSYTEIVDAKDTIVLARAPVISVDTVTIFAPVYAPVLPPPVYLLDSAAGVLRRQPNYLWDYDPDYYGWGYGQPHGNSYGYGMRLSVTYTAGRSVIPAGIQLAARMILDDLWAEKRGGMPLPARGGDTEDVIPGADYTMTNRVLELLAPFTRTSGIA